MIWINWHRLARRTVRPMAGIDWTQAVGIATLVLSLAVICFVAFTL